MSFLKVFIQETRRKAEEIYNELEAIFYQKKKSMKRTFSAFIKRMIADSNLKKIDGHILYWGARKREKEKKKK